MRRIYSDDAYGPIADGTNFWRSTVPNAPLDLTLEGDLTTDIAIIGAGFTGLNAALRLAQKHQVKVAVLEADSVGYGASGRAGGFCCLGGSRVGGQTLKRRYGAQETATYHLAERAAVDHVAQLLAEHGIEADTHSNGETLLAHNAISIQDLHSVADETKAIYGLEAPILSKDALKDHGMKSPGFFGAVTVPIGFALNPLKYVTGLAAAVRDAGGKIYSNSPVQDIVEADNGVRLTTPQGTLTAQKVLVATNGYSSETVPKAMAGRYLPVPSAILATRPLTDNEIAEQGWSSPQMCHDTRTLLHYFRLLPDKRLLFGMRGATRSDQAAMESAKAKAKRDLAAHFPAWADVETPHFWSGFICFSQSFTPFAGQLPGHENVFGAFAYHGNGIAMGSYVGATMADILVGKPPNSPFPKFFANAPKTMPLGRFRNAALPFAYRWYQYQDR